MKRRMISPVILLLLAMLGCDDSFNPKAPFQPRMVIYSVLNTESDTQYVRIYATYDSPDNVPMKNLDEKPVTDATVMITEGTAAYAMRDTVIPRPENDRYQSDIHTYYVYPFRPQRDRSYRLVASSPAYGTAEATVTIPGRGDISILNPALVDDPWHTSDSTIKVQVDISPNTMGFRVIFLVEYEGLGANGWVVHRSEVPVSILAVNRLYLQYAFTFPEVVGRGSMFGLRAFDLQTFGRSAYLWTLDRILVSGFYDLRFKNTIVYLAQFDENLYKNYRTANSFRDRYSIRLDERDFTNIKNGIGVFGAYTLDSSYFRLRPGMRPPSR